MIILPQHTHSAALYCTVLYSTAWTALTTPTPKNHTQPVLTSYVPVLTPYVHRVAAVFPGVQWIQTSSPSAMVDSRTINTAISLVAVTFGYQTIEFQEKAIQFFSQTLLPMFAKQQR